MTLRAEKGGGPDYGPGELYLNEDKRPINKARRLRAAGMRIG